MLASVWHFKQESPLCTLHVHCTYGHLQADFLSLCPERRKEHNIQHILCAPALHMYITLQVENVEKVRNYSSLFGKKGLRCALLCNIYTQFLLIS